MSKVESPGVTARRLARLRARVLAAWAVHAFTASGVVTGLLAIAALIAGDFRLALLWLGAALLIDGFDGPMARKVRVTEFAPSMDGAILDLVIDYLNYTVIPALLVYRFGLVPSGFAIPTAAYIMMTSLYCFGNRDMKTSDNYFQGFPAVWNLVVLYFYITSSNPWLNLAVVLGLGILTFVPMKFVHPFRVRTYRGLTLVMTGAWAALTLVLVLGSETGRAPALTMPIAYWAFIAVSLYFLGLCLLRSFKGPQTA
ncbi:MAG: phosphatidylcholine/phosphatidylserine synthase [Parvibaculum sp.]|uniref:CDP-alcohol phosphatidyltransferase family protein n=1 Tax=Parvibaculum sp. TaxID=2024848 RepID=UPI0025CF5EFF|nr:CDP-alcohol phosphatidyltransferase family protein [Parvibaculum sp.]MCE9648453.1 phosphatidylcholine/phosphatidylserine synthase [Parvibaculum sp.]